MDDTKEKRIPDELAESFKALEVKNVRRAFIRRGQPAGRHKADT